jgi:lipopolysaccharide/colanic/teichoic acid biosynthesis glycosyltransferase
MKRAQSRDAIVAQSAPLDEVGRESALNEVSAGPGRNGIDTRSALNEVSAGLLGAPEAYALPGRMLVDLRTRQITVDLRTVDVGPRAVAPPLNGNEVAIDLDGVGLLYPRIPIGRTGNDRVKRGFDVLLVLLSAPLWMPLVALLAFLVKYTSRGPAFYRQQRVGRHGRAFACTKLRTMTKDADIQLEELLSSDPMLREEFQNRYKLRNDPRVTRIGHFLRRSGLDELPQLFAVLCGRMSLVGPRPIVVPETRYYGPYLPLVETVRPGLTGLWQVSGRNDIPYPLRVGYDVQYVLTRSLWSDVKLIVKTCAVMMRPSRRGSY